MQQQQQLQIDLFFPHLTFNILIYLLSRLVFTFCYFALPFSSKLYPFCSKLRSKFVPIKIKIGTIQLEKFSVLPCPYLISIKIKILPCPYLISVLVPVNLSTFMFLRQSGNIFGLNLFHIITKNTKFNNATYTHFKKLTMIISQLKINLLHSYYTTKIVTKF